MRTIISKPLTFLTLATMVSILTIPIILSDSYSLESSNSDFKFDNLSMKDKDYSKIISPNFPNDEAIIDENTDDSSIISLPSSFSSSSNSNSNNQMSESGESEDTGSADSGTSGGSRDGDDGDSNDGDGFESGEDGRGDESGTDGVGTGDTGSESDGDEEKEEDHKDKTTTINSVEVRLEPLGSADENDDDFPDKMQIGGDGGGSIPPVPPNHGAEGSKTTTTTSPATSPSKSDSSSQSTSVTQTSTKSMPKTTMQGASSQNTNIG